MITLYLPLPPSINKVWQPVSTRKGARLIKRAASRQWASNARWEVLAQRLGAQIDDAFEAIIILPKFRGDVDNRVKQLLDACQAGGAITNDNLCRKLIVERDDTKQGNCEINLIPIIHT